MKIEYDDAKRDWTLLNRGLDFEDASKVFSSLEMELVDDRFDYGEERIITFGQIANRFVAVVWTPKDYETRRIISMRHVHDREIEARRRALD